MAKELDRQAECYAASLEEMEAKHMGKWVVFHDEKFVGAYDSLEEAEIDAYRQFGDDPYMTRQVGAPPVSLPPILTLAKIIGRSD